MKKLTLTFAFIVAATLTTFAQQVAKTKETGISNAEKFSDRSGSLIEKEYIDIGSLKKFNIQVAKYTDLISGQKSSAVRFEAFYTNTYSKSTDSKIALLDADEIDGLIKSIKIIQDKILPTNPTNYTEVAFKSRSGFMAGCFSKENTWDTFIKIDTYDSNSYVFMEKEDLATLLELLTQAKANL